MSKRKSKLAAFLSRVLVWVRYEPKPDADPLQTSTPRLPRLRLKRACEKLEAGLARAPDLIDEATSWEAYRRDHPNASPRRARRALYEAYRPMKRAADLIDRVLDDAQKVDRSRLPEDEQRFHEDLEGLLQALDEQIDIIRQKLNDIRGGRK